MCAIVVTDLDAVHHRIEIGAALSAVRGEVAARAHPAAEYGTSGWVGAISGRF